MTRPMKEDSTIIDILQECSEAGKDHIRTLIERKYLYMDSVKMWETRDPSTQEGAMV